MNKCGGEKILSIWWFLVLAMVAAGVVLGVYMFYSVDLDVRELEANALANRIYDCVNENGYLRDDVFLESFDIYAECDIRKDVFYEDGTGYYLSVEIFDGEVSVFESHSLSENLKRDCDVGKAYDLRDYPRCVTKEESFLFIENGVQKKLNVKILAISHQQGRALPLI